MKHSPLLALALLIGCVTGAAVSKVALPPAQAQATPARWEYTCREDMQDYEGGLQKALDTFAAARWELVSATQSVTKSEVFHWGMCFKRAVY